VNETVDRVIEIAVYANLAEVSRSLGEYRKYKEYLDKAPATSIETGNRAGEASCHGNLGILFHSLGDKVKAKEHYDKSLAISSEICQRKLEAANYHRLHGTRVSRPR